MDATTRFEENTSLVYSALHKFFPDLAFDEDIQQIGMIGLWKACLRFDESKGFTLSTFAYCCIRMEVLKYLRDQRKFKKLPVAFSLDEYLKSDKSQDIPCYIFLGDKDNLYDYSDVIGVFNTVVSECSDRNKRIIQLYLDNLSQQDISREVGCSQPQVSRIISKFKKEMEKELYETSGR